MEEKELGTELPTLGCVRVWRGWWKEQFWPQNLHALRKKNTPNGSVLAGCGVGGLRGRWRRGEAEAAPEAAPEAEWKRASPGIFASFRKGGGEKGGA